MEFMRCALLVVAGERVVGFDNERGKGDHHHIGNNERPYAFVGTDRLIEDFISDVVVFAELGLVERTEPGRRAVSVY